MGVPDSPAEQTRVVFTITSRTWLLGRCFSLYFMFFVVSMAGESCGDEHREDAGDGDFGGAPAKLLLVLGSLLRRPAAGDAS